MFLKAALYFSPEVKKKNPPKPIVFYKQSMNNIKTMLYAKST